MDVMRCKETQIGVQGSNEARGVYCSRSPNAMIYFTVISTTSV